MHVGFPGAVFIKLLHNLITFKQWPSSRSTRMMLVRQIDNSYQESHWLGPSGSIL